MKETIIFQECKTTAKTNIHDSKTPYVHEIHVGHVHSVPVAGGDGCYGSEVGTSSIRSEVSYIGCMLPEKSGRLARGSPSPFRGGHVGGDNGVAAVMETMEGAGLAGLLPK